MGAWLCFEDEAGQGLRLPKGRTWGHRGHTPIVRVTAQGTKRVSMAALICTKPDRRPRLIYRIHLDRDPAKGRRKGFTETDYARLLDAAHQQLGGPVVLVWDCENGGVSGPGWSPPSSQGFPLPRRPSARTLRAASSTRTQRKRTSLYW